MIDWIKSLFGSKQPAPALPPARPDLSKVFLEAIDEVEQETHRQELELLQGTKLQDALKKAIKKMAAQLPDKYDFVLVHDSDVGVQKGAFPIFYKVIKGVLQEYEIPSSMDGDSYFKVDKKHIRPAFEKLRNRNVDIDEHTRSLLRQGIYR